MADDQTPPLDDLLPTNDEHYTPPANLAELFERGGAAWELADVWKWYGVAQNAAFQQGWLAGL